jgi:hypothetical protein
MLCQFRRAFGGQFIQCFGERSRFRAHRHKTLKPPRNGRIFNIQLYSFQTHLAVLCAFA